MVIMAVWSLSAMGHALANTVVEFGIALSLIHISYHSNGASHPDSSPPEGIPDFVPNVYTCGLTSTRPKSHFLKSQR